MSMKVGNVLQHQMVNIPEILLAKEKHRRIQAEITANEQGIMQGIEPMEKKARELGMEVTTLVRSGATLACGKKIAILHGDPLQIITGEDWLISPIAKASGIARMARTAVEQAGRIRVVSGGWKKIPLEMKDTVRAALETGGVGMRLLDQPFLYLDKNYLRVFGSIENLFKATAALPDRVVSVQIRGETSAVENEAVEAAKLGAKVIMVDTGNLTDLRACSKSLKDVNLRNLVQIAFAGGVKVADLAGLQQEDVDIVDIGRDILDASLMDFRYDIIKEQ